jgi:ribosomal protein L40E
MPLARTGGSWRHHRPDWGSNVYAYRADNLRQLGFASYGAYTRSRLWRSIRARVLAGAPVCVRCQARPATQVHHRAYDPATLRGDCLDALSAVCRRCHWAAERPDWWGRTTGRLHRANAMLVPPAVRAARTSQGAMGMAPAPRLVKPAVG